MENELEIKDRYRARIRECFPELVISALEMNTEGLVNDVVIVNGERVFRFPKAEWAKDDLRREVAILELVREYVAMRVPVFDRVEEDFVTYELIPGEALLRDDILRLDERGQDGLAEQLALFLRQLHAIPEEVLGARGVGPSVTVRSRADWLKLYEDVQREVFRLLMAHAKEWVHRHFAPLLREDGFMEHQPALINGDLGPYHLLYDRERRRVSGVIDFGTAGLGDPACDVSGLINNYGESFVRRVVRFYPEIGGMIERARFWAGTLELQWLLGGLRSGDASWFTVHLGRARDVMPVGSGWFIKS
jgi:aminoglycoside 2''-phosphotransferase